MVFDLLITGVRILCGDEVCFGDIGISGGKVVLISSSASTEEATSKIDGRGLLALPGLIDPHVHFRDPGLTHKEDFESGSMAAAAGGVTTVFDMPNTIPPVTSVAAFKNKLEAVSSRSLVNFGLYAAASHANLEEIAPLSKAGAIGFKTYMVGPTSNSSPEYEGCVTTGFVDLLKVMEATSKTGLVHVVHAEDAELVGHLAAKLMSQGRVDPFAHCDSRPGSAEAIAVHKAVALAEITGAKLHVAHLSTAEALEEVRRAKARGVRVTCETCPQYLLLTRESLEKYGPYAKFNPPARTQRDVEALVAGIREGVVDVLASDHAPHTREEKEAGRKNIWAAPSGVPGVETRLPILLAKASEWGLTLRDVVRLCSKNAAKIFGLGGRKGAIAVGYDADIVLVDPYSEWTIRAEALYTKAREDFVFDGMRVKGKVKYTVVRGELVYEEGVGFSKPTKERFVAGPMRLH